MTTYIDLGPDDVICEGDEYSGIYGDGWLGVQATRGATVANARSRYGSGFRVRRPVATAPCLPITSPGRYRQRNGEEIEIVANANYYGSLYPWRSLREMRDMGSEHRLWHESGSNWHPNTGKHKQPNPFDIIARVDAPWVPVVGAFAKTRDGRKAFVGYRLPGTNDCDQLQGYIVEKDGTAGSVSWDDGGYFYGAGDPQRHDLIADWSDPPPPRVVERDFAVVLDGLGGLAIHNSDSHAPCLCRFRVAFREGDKLPTIEEVTP
jgi:hypothetical protein